MNIEMRILRLVFCVAVCTMLVACAGVRCKVIAPQVNQPVSMTPAVLNTSGDVIAAGPTEIVNHFRFRRCNWAVFWTLIPLSSRIVDVSPELNNLLVQYQGDAVVNLTVTTQGDWWWYFTSLMPIIPDYQWIVVEGDIARFPKPQAPKPEVAK